MDCSASCWLSNASNQDQWIQYDFGKLTRVTKIQTLGRPQEGKQGDYQWVSEYRVSYTRDGKLWKFLNRTFAGNEAHNETVEHVLHRPLLATKVKLHPTQWHNRIALRAELIGCAATEGEGNSSTVATEGNSSTVCG